MGTEAQSSESDEFILRMFTSRSNRTYRLSPLIDDTLSSAARASKATSHASQEVDRVFDKAVRALGKYEETFYTK